MINHIVLIRRYHPGLTALDALNAAQKDLTLAREQVSWFESRASEAVSRLEIELVRDRLRTLELENTRLQARL